MSDKTTHFGYQKVQASEKAARVRAVFDSVAERYDVMNDLMSFGVHRLWKRFCVEVSRVRPGQRVLDLAGGTGDLAAHFSRRVGPTGHVVLADINSSMLACGRDRLLDQGISGNLEFVQVDAESLPFPQCTFHCVTMAFGLRNVTRKENALAAIRNTLTPGGQALILEFSQPTSRGLRRLYDAYSFSVLPKLGKLVTGDSDSYQYLAESIRIHPDQERLKEMMESAGFERCEYFNLTGGIVAVHRGYRF